MRWRVYCHLQLELTHGSDAGDITEWHRITDPGDTTSASTEAGGGIFGVYTQ